MTATKTMRRRYPIVVERGANSLSAYLPDVPGCVVTADSVDSVLSSARVALELHLAGLAEDGIVLPEPLTVVIKGLSDGDEIRYVDVQLPDPKASVN